MPLERISGPMVTDASLTGADIQDGSINTGDLADGAVTRAKTGESLIRLGTLQATTSGTSRDFTGIPSWARRIVLLLNGVSTNASSTDDLLIQLGVGTSPTTSGYQNAQSTLSYPTGILSVTSTAGIPIFYNFNAYSFTGRVVIELLDSTANTWLVNGVVITTLSTIGTIISGGAITLSGALGMVRLTTTSGTATFDAGSVNISWE